MKRLASALLAALCLILYACDEPSMLAPEGDNGNAALSSAKGPKGGGGKDPPPGGTVFFRDWDEEATYSMDAGGGNVQVFPASVTGIPSRELHGGYRWFLHVETVGGTYSDGVPRQEVFATGANPGNPSTTTIQLTNDPDVHPRDDESSLWWSPGDAKLGFKGRRLAAAGHVSEGGLFVLDVDFTSGSPTPVLPPTLVVATTISQQPEWCEIGTGEVCEESLLAGFDWSPDMDRIVYGDGSLGVVRIHGAQDLAAGHQPRWSPPTAGLPDGRIIFNRDLRSLWTIEPNPDGSGANLQEVIRTRSLRSVVRSVEYPRWSPTGEHFVYEWFELNMASPAEFRFEGRVYRVEADGSGKTCLTCRGFDLAQPLAWW